MGLVGYTFDTRCLKDIYITVLLVLGEFVCFHQYLDASNNRGAPKWMVKIMNNPIKMDDLGVPLFLETPISRSSKITKHQTTSRTVFAKPSLGKL